MSFNLLGTFVLNLILAIIYIFSFTYYFQIKEYRFDRLFSFLREKGFLQSLIPDKFYKPKPSFRNLIIVGLSFLLVLLVIIKTDWLFGWLLGIAGVVAGVLVTEPVSLLKRNIDITKAKKKLAKSSTQVIGITGSYGKTSTKEFLYQILKTQFETEKTMQNFNTNVGVAISINKNLKPQTQYFVAEIGAYKIGEIKTVTNWVKPKYGILTALGNQHIDLFGSKENLIKAKKELLTSLPKEGTAYVNIDSKGFEKATNEIQAKVVKYSASSNNADIYIEKLNITDSKTSVDVTYHNERFNLSTGLIGKHNLVNLLPCIALAYDLGISKEKILKAIGNLKNEFGKLSLHKGLKGSQVLFDGKNSNVNGFISALETLASLNTPTKLVITKGIIELGKEKKRSYETILRKLRKSKAKMITTDKLFNELDEHADVRLVKTEKEIYEFLHQQLDNSSALLVEGKFTEPFVTKLGISNG